MKGRKEIVLALALVLLSTWILGNKLLSSGTESPNMGPNYFTERLGLAGEFSGPLPGGLERHIKALALRLESDPARLAVLRAEPLARELEQGLSPSFRSWALYNHGHGHVSRKALVEAGYDSLIRLIFCFLAGLGVVLSVSLIFLFMGASPEDQQEEFPAPPWPRIILVFGSWLVSNALMLKLIQGTMVGEVSRFTLIMTAQLVYYGLAAALLATAWRWGSWRPWKALDGRLVGGTFLALLALMPATEWLVEMLTGVTPQLHLSLLPYFRGLTMGQGSTLALMAIFIGPIFEELMFRGWILGGLKSQWGPGKALLISSALFALAHGSVWALPGAFAFALVAGFLALRTESIASSILLHVLWNATTLVWLFAAL